MPLAVCSRDDYSAAGEEPYDGPSLACLDTMMGLIAAEWRATVNRHFARYPGAARVSGPDVSIDMLLDFLMEHVFADTWHDVKLAEEDVFGD